MNYQMIFYQGNFFQLGLRIISNLIQGQEYSHFFRQLNYLSQIYNVCIHCMHQLCVYLHTHTHTHTRNSMHSFFKTHYGSVCVCVMVSFFATLNKAVLWNNITKSAFFMAEFGILDDRIWHFRWIQCLSETAFFIRSRGREWLFFYIRKTYGASRAFSIAL